MKILNSMSSFIPLPAIIQRILQVGPQSLLLHTQCDCQCQTLTPVSGTFQDPVYGKGKLAEIQGLILGMLDTFNYEQVKLFGEGSHAVSNPRRPIPEVIDYTATLSTSSGLIDRCLFCCRLSWKRPPVC